jgi:APA family basic amino acid/polyamine antiporter
MDATNMLPLKGVSQPKKELSLFDSTCLIVGIIIGAGIYQMAPDIAKGAGGVWGVGAIWVIGGLLSLCGAVGYAELATTYPQEGGDYVYLSRAYGPWAGFLFGWVQLAVVRPGDIVVMAFAFATYARTIWDPFGGVLQPWSQEIFAIAAVLVLTILNVLGVREGKCKQNLLTSVKAAGLLAIVGVALVVSQTPVAPGPVASLPPSLALIFVLFVFGGWNEMAYVAAEVKDPNRNIVRALVLGTAAVTVLYLLVNGAFLYALGYAGMANSKAVATDTVATVFPRFGGNLISALISISALGAVNGLIFTGARISYAVGADHRAFRVLGRWHPRTGTPVSALLVQGGIAVTLILIFGSFVDAILYTAPAVYTFYLASSLAVMVLRAKEPTVARPYRVAAYPLPTLLFSAVCGFLIYSAVTYKPWIALAALGICLLGLPIYWAGRRFGRSDSRPPQGANNASDGTTEMS